MHNLARCFGLVPFTAALAVAFTSLPAAAGDGELVILHTNDIHGKFRPTAATWKDGNPPIGGYANLSAYINEERADTTRSSILLDAGDLMTGNPICDYEYDSAKGGAMMEFMNELGYDAMCLGNHEFDHGLDELDRLMAIATFPVISANTYRPDDGGLTAPHPYIIVERDSLRVGIIGVMTEHLYSVAAPSRLAGTVVKPAFAEVQRSIDAIDEQTDLIILLSHQGLRDDRALAQRIQNADIIVGGHSHTRLEEPQVIGGVIIVQAGAHNRMMGRLSVTVKDDAVVAHEGKLIELWPREGADPDVAALMQQYSSRIDEDYGVVIGELASEWDRSYYGESNIGNWLCDQLKESQNADFAVLNSGGIRRDVPAGPVTKLDVLEVLPFTNMVTTFTCTGKELRTLIKKNAEAGALEQRGILQISGITYRYSVSKDRSTVKVEEAQINGKPISNSKTYTGATVDYVSVGNAMRYFGFHPSETTVTDVLVADAIIKAMQSSSDPIDAKVEGRMMEIKTKRRGS